MGEWVFKTIAQVWKLVGGLSSPSKMPCHSWSIPAKDCITGSKLRKVPGTVCSVCYAFERGNYVRPNVKKALAKRLVLWRRNRALWRHAMAWLINRMNEGLFRWFDSGDLQSYEMLEDFVWVARACPTTKFWLPTREYAFARRWYQTNGPWPANLNVRLSAHKINMPGPRALAKEIGCTVGEVYSDGTHTCTAKYWNAKEKKWDAKCDHDGWWHPETGIWHPGQNCRRCFFKEYPVESYPEH